MPKMTPFLMFNNQAEEAVALYVSLFPDSKVVNLSRYGEGGPAPAGSVMSATLLLAGQELHIFNGGPTFAFSDGISLFVSCETQAEVDALWDKLTANGGEPGRCGWLKDKFGVSWQIIPDTLGQLLSDPDPARAGRAMQAMLQMSKLDVAGLQRAADGA